jgi:hypothetical protein
MGSICVERATKEISFSLFHFSLFTGTLTKVRSLVAGRDRGYNTVCKVNATLFLFFFMFTVVLTTCHPFDKNKKNIQHHKNTKQYKLQEQKHKRQAPKIARIKVLSRKAENQSYQATIQTDCQNEPNSCKIQRPVPRLLKCHHCTCLCTSIFFGRHTGRKERMAGRDFKGKVLYF